MRFYRKHLYLDTVFIPHFLINDFNVDFDIWTFKTNLFHQTSIFMVCFQNLQSCHYWNEISSKGLFYLDLEEAFGMNLVLISLLRTADLEIVWPINFLLYTRIWVKQIQLTKCIFFLQNSNIPVGPLGADDTMYNGWKNFLSEETCPL